jgi:hypothetical protein
LFSYFKIFLESINIVCYNILKIYKEGKMLVAKKEYTIQGYKLILRNTDENEA